MIGAKANIRINLLAGIALSLGISCCGDTSEPLTSSGPFIDMRLWGDWINTLTLSDNGFYTVHGIRINPDGSTIPLGINARTGQLSLIIPYTPNILGVSSRLAFTYAQLGHCGIDLIMTPSGRVQFDLRYSVEGDSVLTVGTDIYRRSRVGSSIVKPQQFNFRCLKDSVEYLPYDSFCKPPAFARFDTVKGGVSFTIFCQRVVKFLNIETISLCLMNVTQSGMYSLDTLHRGSFNLFSGDSDFLYLTDSRNRGFVQVQIDYSMKRCSGVFSFDASLGFNPKIELREGSFDVPIYD